MQTPPTPEDERERLAALHGLGILDTPADERFDRVTRLAQKIFEVPIAVVSLVDQDRQWFKSVQGLDAQETPRNISFCGHAILGDELFVVPDARVDERFSDNPLVAGDPRIRFYAGFPLGTPSGHKLGTLCLIDRRPRDLTDEQRSMLRDLGELVERELRAHQLAAQDDLTGLSNRRGFRNVAQHVVSICRRLGRPALLVYLDLNEFKAINDTHGHAFGDGILREFADHLREAFRASDVIARLGGDEFAVLLTGSADGDQALERLHARLAERNRGSPDSPGIQYTAGCVPLDPKRHASLDEFMEDADAAMYARKPRVP